MNPYTLLIQSTQWKQCIHWWKVLFKRSAHDFFLGQMFHSVLLLSCSVLHSCTLFISWKACHIRGACRPTQTSVRLSVEPTTSCCPSVRPSALPAQRLATWTSQHSCIGSRNQDVRRLLLRRLRSTVIMLSGSSINRKQRKYFPEVFNLQWYQMQYMEMFKNSIINEYRELFQGRFRPSWNGNDFLKLPLENSSGQFA